jgi:hypothetical protein
MTSPAKPSLRKAGQKAPGGVAFYLSKASAPLKLHQRNTQGQSQSQSQPQPQPHKSKPSDDDFATRGLSADAFFGASPVVASALDLRVGRDPFADHIQTNRHFFSARPKPDISTLQRIGHFYFALTRT